MTTTLRPAGPEMRGADGARARPYAVCVNSRPVGGVELRVDGRFGPTVGSIVGLAVDEVDRRRGRGAAAALAGEEVLRSWGCTRVQASVPSDAPYALRLAAALGYTETSLHMAKDLDGADHALPPGSTVRALSEAEYVPWLDLGGEGFVTSLTDMGVPRDRAEAREAEARAELLRGVPGPATALLGLDHDGANVGFLWLRTREPAWVVTVAVDEAHRARGHGRTAMLAAENHCRAAGLTALNLEVFAANTVARRLYESLGYRTTIRHFSKTLV